MSTEAKPVPLHVQELQARLAVLDDKLKNRIPKFPEEYRAESDARTRNEITVLKKAIAEASK